ncbi:hypothetical protein POPTR_019G016702v4 [Populus trichocarpa]|uniref:Uncharacterized protein n=1 Tax=Populus trichocarpa TaxID=3694 RepID=A0A3N7GAX4_POPTR|nr:hypothetical protein POPTR_019G016702v4 [Populus trichocarpa]
MLSSFWTVEIGIPFSGKVSCALNSSSSVSGEAVGTGQLHGVAARAPILGLSGSRQG